MFCICHRDAVFVTLLLLFFVGCGGAAGTGYPETVPVSGTVTYGDQPVESATVMFQALDGSRSAVGKTDSQGRYELTTFQPGDGAEPGEYRVSIVAFEEPDELFDEEKHPEGFPLKNLLPAQYADPKSSGLEATVSAEAGPLSLDFSLQ